MGGGTRNKSSQEPASVQIPQITRKANFYNPAKFLAEIPRREEKRAVLQRWLIFRGYVGRKKILELLVRNSFRGADRGTGTSPSLPAGIERCFFDRAKIRRFQARVQNGSI